MNTDTQFEAMKTDKTICSHCWGQGQLANDDDESPWMTWAELPPPSNMAVVIGVVRPVTCKYCNGTGKKP